MARFVIAGHSRSKNGVASARLCPGNPSRERPFFKEMDARVKPAHDG
jgi:hypothetical protein